MKAFSVAMHRAPHAPTGEVNARRSPLMPSDGWVECYAAALNGHALPLEGELACLHGSVRGEDCPACDEELSPTLRALTG